MGYDDERFYGFQLRRAWSRGRLLTTHVSRVLCAVLLGLTMTYTGFVWAAGGDVVWDDEFDGGGGLNIGRAITAKGSRVIAAGEGSSATGGVQWVVRAYKRKTGELLWEDQFDAGGTPNVAHAVAALGSRIFAAGEGSTQEGGVRWVVRAYKRKSGVLLWEDRFDRGGGFSRVVAIGARKGRVFGAGDGANSAGRVEWVVRAYDAKTGAVLWGDQFDRGGNTHATALAAGEKRVFVAGMGSDRTQNATTAWLVRAYDAKTGVILWQDEFNDGGGQNIPRAIAVKGSRVFVAGYALTSDGIFPWLVRAYDVKNGALLWENRFDKGRQNIARALAIKGSRLFVAGDAWVSGDNHEWVVRAHDVKTGALLWSDQFNPEGGTDFAGAVTAKSSRVFVAGNTAKSPDIAEWTVRAYDGKTGALLWEHTFDNGAGKSSARAITAKGSRVFAGGDSSTAAENQEWVVQAYEAK